MWTFEDLWIVKYTCSNVNIQFYYVAYPNFSYYIFKLDLKGAGSTYIITAFERYW